MGGNRYKTKNEKEVTRFEVSTNEGIYRMGIIEKEGKLFFIISLNGKRIKCLEVII